MRYYSWYWWQTYSYVSLSSSAVGWKGSSSNSSFKAFLPPRGEGEGARRRSCSTAWHLVGWIGGLELTAKRGCQKTLMIMKVEWIFSPWLIFYFFRFITPISTRFRVQCALTWSIRLGRPSMTFQTYSRASCLSFSHTPTPQTLSMGMQPPCIFTGINK